MKQLSLFLIALFCANILLAQGSSTGSSYLKVVSNPRSAALGEALVADTGELSASLVNPANLATQGSVSLLLSHTEWIQDVQTEFAGMRLPYSFGTFGFMLSNTNVKGIEIREGPGPSLGTFNARSAVFQLGFATAVLEEVTLGASAKYIYEKLYIDETTGLGFDIGGSYQTPIEGLQAALSLTNIGSLQKFRNESSDLPSLLHIGARYIVPLSEFNVAFHAAGANDIEAKETHLQVGAEAFYNNLVALRVGYQSAFDSRGVSAGIGIRYSLAQVDYAYVPFSFGLGNAHLFSVGFNF